MDIRVLKYFLAVAREQSFSQAANMLYLSQPTLSRQLHELEQELGRQLFVRGNKGVTLTEDGMMLRKRAEEIIELVEKTEEELKHNSDHINGTVYIGAGETYAFKLIADTGKKIQNKYPDVKLSIFSGDGSDVLERLDKGLIDFGVIFQELDDTKYESVEIPLHDTWGVLTRRDSPLAEKSEIDFSELAEYPLIIPRQPNHTTLISKLIEEQTQKKKININVVSEYNLVYNASVLVKEGMGSAITLDKLINVSGNSEICFIPLKPLTEAVCRFAWKRYSVFSKAADKFLEMFLEDMKNYK